MPKFDSYRGLGLTESIKASGRKALEGEWRMASGRG
ncbi:hypothetical protein FHT67_000219 [Paenibacillus sp. BK720]|nr:hypothetical protein [Paenibacillus sp. BK720]